MTIVQKTALPVHAPSFIKPRPGRRPRRPSPPRALPRPSVHRNPRDSWPSWTDQRWTIGPAAEPISRPIPEPTAASMAWENGFQRGYDHDADAIPPAGMPEALALSWWHGRNTGWLRREHEDLMIDNLEAESRQEVEAPEDRASDSERLEVMGSAAFSRRNDWD